MNEAHADREERANASRREPETGGQRPPITVADVRASLDRAVRAPLPIAWFGRPLGDLCTPFFYNRGWSANAVTGLRTAVAGAALLALASGLPFLWASAAAAFYAVYVLDCVDGNLSRLLDTASYWGKFADGVSDFVFIGFAPLAAGAGLWFREGDGLALLAGAAITALALANEILRNRLSFFRDWMIAQTGPLRPEDEAARALPMRIERQAAAVVINGTFLAPLLLFHPGWGAYYLWALAAVQAVPDAVRLGASLHHARVILGRWRRSIHAAPPPAGD